MSSSLRPRRLLSSLTAALGAIALGVTGLVAVTATPANAAGPRPLFQLPFPCGESWRLSTYPGHDDYDVDMIATSGTTAGRSILASYAGTVSYSGWDNGGGWYVKLNHGGGWETLYLHMQSAPAVSTGQSVHRGDLLGRVGSTGNSSGPHLHHEQRRDGAKVETWFNGSPSGITTDGYPSGEPISPSVTLVSANCAGVDVSGGSLSDVSGDGYADLLATKPDGTLHYYSNNINSNPDNRPFTTGREIGTGWNGLDRVMSGDVSGDGYADVIGTKPDGTLWYYPNNIRSNPDNRPYTSGREIGSGWNGFNRLLLGDVTGDAHADLIATK
ncbi:peptidoglycan DD-metalloendopeptidase family protein, partial [Micromonospora echinaurantiaca]|uniref:peptidoglycan DD-metalloendopeptidase family protein n=1 Tax=Micromonospora echinaurantiaca TaxID=47857 RepID=UPI003712D0E3